MKNTNQSDLRDTEIVLHQEEEEEEGEEKEVVFSCAEIYHERRAGARKGKTRPRGKIQL